MTRVLSWPVSSDCEALDAGSLPARPRRLSPALAERWDAVLVQAGAPDAVRENRKRLGQAHCRVVVTGQQPGVWGGPLYSLYKAATAVALARRLSADGGVPAVPVFWIQGDDTDWDEVGWGALPRRDLGIVRHRWHPAPVPSRHWVGSAVLEPQDAMAAVFADWSIDPGMFSLDPAPGRDLVRGFMDSLIALFGSEGLVPLDSRWPELRAAGESLWERYLPRHAEVARAVQEAGAQGDGDPPLDAAASDHGLFILDGEHRLPVDPATWEGAAGDALASGRARDLAPSVLLRAVLQDHVLGTAAHVVGHGEGAYLRQINPVYRVLQVEPPRRVPRLHATVFPHGLVSGTEMPDVLRDPETWIGGQAAARTPADAREALAALRRETEVRLAVLAGPEGNGELGQLAASARRKIESQLARLDEAVERQARRDLYREHPRLRHLGEFLHPRRGPQERGLSGAALACCFGAEAPAVILEAAEAHLDRLRAGDLHHFIMEAVRE